ncbi:MAG: sugar phosphate isomerase/epimerase [Phycisphaerales bacterium]|jgi:sugar phosphate isomerase/epimerase|nr:sugar phosphate isomerase/epimerase [Phycisphaerales bacterium]
MYCCLDHGTAGRGLPLDQFTQIAAEAGFQGADVDLSYGVEQGVDALRQLYQRHKLRFGAWGLPDWRGADPLSADDLRQLNAQAKVASQLSIDRCCTYILPSGDLPLMENWKFHQLRLTPIARILADHGLRLGLEFVSPEHLRRRGKHEFIFTPGQMLELANDIGTNAGLLVDSFHCHAAQVSLDQLASLPAKRIVWVHINDAPDLPLSKLEDFERVLPGDGVINLSGFLTALIKTGYTGGCSLEVFSSKLSAMPPAAAARLAWLATHRLIEGIPSATT